MENKKHVEEIASGVTKENQKLIDRVMSDSFNGLTMEEIIAGAAKENQIYLVNMNGFEMHYFRIGLNEGLRLAERILKEVQDNLKEV